MKNAEKIGAEQIMETEPLKALNDQSLSQIKNTMEEEEVRALPVVNSQNQLQGVIGYRDLIRHIQFNPENTSLSKVMHQPPEFEKGDDLIEIADLRINSGRKLLVNKQKKKLKGVISDKELLNALTEVQELEDITTKDVGTTDLINVFEEDGIEKARHEMLDNSISRLPVLDKDGKTAGILRSTDILRTMIPRSSPSPGGRSGRRKGNQAQMAGGDEKDRMSQIPSKEIMDRSVNTSDGHISGLEAVEKMVEKGQGEVLITDSGYPESIVTLKDFIEFLEGFAPGNTVLVNLIGLEVPEEKAAVHRKIKKQLQGSLGRKLHRPEEISLYFRKSEKDGKKHRYEVDLKLFSEFGQTTIDEEGWELLDVVDESLNKLNEVIRRKNEEMTEHH